MTVYPCVYREHVITNVLALACSRFIPVYTGNTIENILYLYLYAVYPCVYREHTIQQYLIFVLTGLSLCIQGTQFVVKTPICPPRFIPVYTGNTVIVA